MLSEFKKKIQKLNRDDLPAKDLMEALSRTIREDKAEIGSEIIQKDIRPIFSKIKSSLSSVKDFRFSMLKSIKLLPNLKSSTKGLVSDLTDDYKKCENDSEKLKYISMLIVYTASLGAGARRTLMKPAIAPVLMVWTVSALFIRTLEKAQTKIPEASPSQELVKQLASVLQMLALGFGLELQTTLLPSSIGGKLDVDEFSMENVDAYLTKTRVDEWAYKTVKRFLERIGG